MMTEREKELQRLQKADAKKIEKRIAFDLEDPKLTEGSRCAAAENAHYFAHIKGIWPLVNKETRRKICLAMLGIFPRYEYVMTITTEEVDDDKGNASREKREWKAGSLF